MRCSCCSYKQQVYHIEDDYCTVCLLTGEEEQTENKYGIGCIHTKKTLDKRNNQLKQYIKKGLYV